MLSLILVEAGLRPSFVIGADVNEIGTNAVWDTGEWLVVEADESYGTFQAIRPDLAVLTNVEPDHLDYYGTFEALRGAFVLLRGAAPRGRRRVRGRPRGGGHRPGRTARSRVGTDAGVDLRHGRRWTCSAARCPSACAGRTASWARSRIGVPGPAQRPQRRAGRGGGARRPGRPSRRRRRRSPASPASPAASSSAARRSGVTFVDDYAHLPTEVRAALATARSGGWSRVVAVFQPHRFSRTAALAAEFGTAFGDADVLVVTDVYSAGERPVPGVSGRLVADAVRAQDPRLPVTYAPGWEELRRAVGRTLRAGRPLPHPGRRRPDHAPRRAARVTAVVTPSPELRALAGRAWASGPTLMKPLGPLTTYGVGGPAALYVEIEGPVDLDAVRAACAVASGTGSAGLRHRAGLQPLGVRRAVSTGSCCTSVPVSPGCDAARAAAVRARRALGGTVPARAATAPRRCACRCRARGARPSWPGGWPMPAGRVCRGPSGCPGPSAARCA